MRIGFELFSPSPQGGSTFVNADRASNIAFMPLAIPLMCGPGAIATILGMMSTIRQSHDIVRSFSAIVAAIALTMLVTNLCLAYAGSLIARIGPTGIDAVTRIVGFFVSAMGVSLIFDGVIEALKAHGLTALH
jgi:multiple antibiotic resistance protein